MRLTPWCVFAFFPLAAIANPPGCKGTGLRPDGVLSASELRATQDPVSSDPVISEAHYLLYGPDSLSSEGMYRAISIPWSKARRLILLGSVTRIYVSHPDKHVYLGAKSGKSYVAKMSEPHDLSDLLKRVESLSHLASRCAAVTANNRWRGP